MKLIKVITSFVAIALATSLPGKAQIIYPADNGFESPNLGATEDYTADPAGTPWTFTGNSGIVTNGTTGNYPVGATDGQASDSSVSSLGQGGYLQFTSSISQEISLPAGDYTVAFDFETQPGTVGTSIDVSLGSYTLFSGAPPSSTQFSPAIVGSTGNLPLGMYDLVFSSTSANYGTVIDNIAIMAVPEPSTWALMAGGLGLLAFWRMRRDGRFAGSLEPAGQPQDDAVDP